MQEDEPVTRPENVRHSTQSVKFSEHEIQSYVDKHSKIGREIDLAVPKLNQFLENEIHENVLEMEKFILKTQNIEIIDLGIIRLILDEYLTRNSGDETLLWKLKNYVHTIQVHLNGKKSQLRRKLILENVEESRKKNLETDSTGRYLFVDISNNKNLSSEQSPASTSFKPNIPRREVSQNKEPSTRHLRDRQPDDIVQRKRQRLENERETSSIDLSATTSDSDVGKPIKSQQMNSSRQNRIQHTSSSSQTRINSENTEEPSGSKRIPKRNTENSTSGMVDPRDQQLNDPANPGWEYERRRPSANHRETSSDQHPSVSCQTPNGYGSEQGKMNEVEVIGEQIEGEKRSTQALIMGAPEELDGQEEKLINEFLVKKVIDMRRVYEFQRMGVKDPSKIRPILITFKSKEDVETAVGNSRNLPKGIYIKTRKQKEAKKSNECKTERLFKTLESDHDRVLLYYQNARSLNNKLTDVTAQSLQSVDVLIITETWLQPNTTSESLLFNLLDDYNIFRCDRDLLYTNLQRGGGVLIAMKKKWFAERIDIRVSVECLILRTVLKQKKIILCAVYIPPNSFGEHSEFLSALDSVAQKYPDHELIVIGDFNIPRIRWDNDPLRCTVTRYVPPAITRCADEMCDFFSILGFHQIIQPQEPENYTLDLLFSFPGLVRETDGNIIFRRDKNDPSSHWFEITV